MARNIQTDEKQGHTTKFTLPSKAIIYNQSTKKELPRQEKAKGVHHHQTSITKMLKGQEEETKNMNNKMAITTYLSIITLNRLNVPIKGHNVTEWVRMDKPHTYAAYKRPTIGQKTYTD